LIEYGGTRGRRQERKARTMVTLVVMAGGQREMAMIVVRS